MDDKTEQRPESLLPYEEWTEQALRQVVVRALQHVAQNGLPGEHHFYITFSTTDLGVSMPARLRAQYKQEMTIVLQHQFWELKVEADHFSVGLSFGGVPSSLVVPFGAVLAFADPHVGVGMRFRPAPPQAANAAEEDEPVPPPQAGSDEATQIVSLDAFRRRTPPKE